MTALWCVCRGIRDRAVEWRAADGMGSGEAVS